ncbi:PAQR family membrane homeostasis protein TrhA [Pediococcus pentosaceus]|uniref:PAQR family membrane homeostasis protein TrhA n=1 Tax=Pediococcus pentosaceus TaxID=1255 RepID=UPI001C7D30C7|nr:hemolysin III family protein [Pediococcus pentosaceus]QYY85063.1 hemolysin III family protein [Pediococcus pentosaceus]
MVQTRRNQIIYEVWNAVTHGVAFFGSLGLVILLIVKAVTQNLSSTAITSLVIYGATLLMLYLASTLFHCLAFTKARRVFQIFDHSNIFLLIAGTYTPYCIIFVGGTSGILMLSMIWAMALAGIITHIWSKGRFQKVETTIYVIMGWMCLLAGKALYANLSPIGFWLLVAGGVVFTVGAVIYSFPCIPGLHLIWHFFVMAGTMLMFGSIYLNI